MKNFIQLNREYRNEILFINVNEISSIRFTPNSERINMTNGETHSIFETPEELFEKIKIATGEIKS